jgi:hypothetical protein
LQLLHPHLDLLAAVFERLNGLSIHGEAAACQLRGDLVELGA